MESFIEKSQAVLWGLPDEVILSAGGRLDEGGAKWLFSAKPEIPGIAFSEEQGRPFYLGGSQIGGGRETVFRAACQAVAPAGRMAHLAVPHKEPWSHPGWGVWVVVWPGGDIPLGLPATGLISGQGVCRDGHIPEGGRLKEQIFLTDRNIPVGHVERDADGALSGVYLWWDAVHSGSEREVEIFRRVLAGVADGSWLRKPGKSVHIQVDKSTAISELEGRVKEAMRNIAAATAELEVFRALHGKKTMVATKSPLVSAVALAGADIVVATKEIEIVRGGIKIPVGSYTITISPKGGSVSMLRDGGGVAVQSMRGLQAPHVMSDGGPCWGNMAEAVADCFAKQDYSSLIDLCVIFLQEINLEDSAGRAWLSRVVTAEDYITLRGCSYGDE